MAGTVAPMDVRMAAALAGEIANVAAFCRLHQISRKTFYKWKTRFVQDGVEGLRERSRRPGRVPGATPVEVEDLIVATRKELAGAGHDHGPDPIRWVLQARGIDPPSTATVARVLARRGQVVPCPARRPRSSLHRFVYARPNECWQSDWTSWQLGDGSPVAIAGTLDDHSRLLAGLAAGAGDGDGPLVWSVMAAAIGRYGVPQRSLTDNGLCYSTARRGLSPSDFETNLRALGCQPITSTPYHPQTCGKIERFWQTLKRWLRAHETRHGLATDLAELNTRLQLFADYYNTRRPHRALQGRTPLEAYHATPAARPVERPLPAPITVHHVVVDQRGVAQVAHQHIHVGTRWRGTPVDAVKDGNRIALFAGNHLIRALDIDPTRQYQPAQQGPLTH